MFIKGNHNLKMVEVCMVDIIGMVVREQWEQRMYVGVGQTFPAICKIILYDRTSLYEVTILNLYAVNIHGV